MNLSRPPPEVLAAFGATGGPTRQPGGQGHAWRADDIILKPCGDPAEAAWVAEVLAGLAPTPRFRVATPVPAVGGGWVVSGWHAWRVIAGEPDPRRCDEVLDVAEAFHAAIAGLARPAFLDSRDDPWSYGDRVAWGDLPPPAGDLIERLASRRRPLNRPAQVIHGDLLGNVLFATGLPPAVIDWPVYFRPALWAQAIVVVDAVTWYGAPDDRLRRPRHPDWGQLLVRALMYRIATNEGMRRAGRPAREREGEYRRIVDLALRTVRA